jgi:hypothetical protein
MTVFPQQQRFLWRIRLTADYKLEAVPIGDGMQIEEKNFCLARKKLAGILTDFKSF